MTTLSVGFWCAYSSNYFKTGETSGDKFSFYIPPEPNQKISTNEI